MHSDKYDIKISITSNFSSITFPFRFHGTVIVPKYNYKAKLFFYHVRYYDRSKLNNSKLTLRQNYRRQTDKYHQLPQPPKYSHSRSDQWKN